MYNQELVVINKKIEKIVPLGFSDVIEYLGGLEVIATKSSDKKFWILEPDFLELALRLQRKNDYKKLLENFKLNFLESTLIPSEMAKIAT